MKYLNRLFLVIGFMILMLPLQVVEAETLEEQINNLIGPQKQYNTHLSPVYLKTIKTEEEISPQSGELVITQTDYVLPGRNGLDLEIKRIYKSGISNVQEMKVKYVNGAWVDYIHSDANTSSFYEDRYNIGIGMRFSFPTIEIRKNSDGTSHNFLHTENGDVYRLKAYTMDGVLTYLIEGQTIKDVKVRESSSFNNGQNDGKSKYIMTDKDGKKTYFADDGRILGIEDRYGNTITFEYTTLNYSIDGANITKRLISKITDTIGRVVTIEYKEDATFKVGPIVNEQFSAEESYKTSQNPNKTDSGNLNEKFQVIIHLPNQKQITYDKTAALVSSSKHVIRTRLQRVFDVDNKPKYHFWYEQPDLGFTYTNGTKYSVYNRYENLVQIDYVKTNHIKQYIYNTFTQELSDGSMQYRKIFSKQDLIKKSYDLKKENFLEKFITEVKDQTNYSYTNEPDGYGFSGYRKNDNNYLKNTFRYYSTITDIKGNETHFSYDGIHQLLSTEERGKDHKEVITTERDEMKLVKKQEILIYPYSNGKETGTPIKKIENFRYDEYGNLTNYTGPEANRDDTGYPIDNEHTVVYSYAYDKFHAPLLKTWKIDPNTTSQIIYEVDDKGNISKETRVNTSDKSNWVETLYDYDSYGNMVKEEKRSGNQSFINQFEFGSDANGVDHKGAYLTKKYAYTDGKEIATKYAFDLNTGNLIGELDPKGYRTEYQYDVLNRVVKVTQSDNNVKEYQYEEKPYANLLISYKDPKGTAFQYEYDILGNLLISSIFDNNRWNVVETNEYDAKGNKTKETNANGHSILFEYDSQYRLIKKTFLENNTVNKGSLAIRYDVSNDPNNPLNVTITDELGYSKKYYYDFLNRLTKLETTPDHVQIYSSTSEYDYVGNKISSTDERGNSTRFVVDNLGRVIKLIDALGHETTITYNALNQIVTQTEPGGKVTDHLYDELGRLQEKRVYQAGSNNNYTYTKYVYDHASNIISEKHGQMIHTVDQLASEISYVYDQMNRIIEKNQKVDQSRIARTSYSYDKNGNRIQEIHYADQEDTSYRIYNSEYDYNGRVLEEKGSYKESEGTGKINERGSYHKRYEYDYVGNRIKDHVWNGSRFETTSYIYDYRNQTKEKIEPFTSNDSIKTTKYEYDKVGNLVSETISVLGSNVTTVFSYDGLGRLFSKSDPLGNRSRYMYDASGNLVKVVDARYQNLPIEQAPGLEYEYDALNRMTKTTAFDGKSKEVIAYKEYDGRGNLIKDVKGEGFNSIKPNLSIGDQYEYDANDRLMTFTSAQTAANNRKNGTNDVTKQYNYDGIGNILSEIDAEGYSNQYSYYLNGLLKEKTYPDGKIESYDYDLTGKSVMIKKDRAGYETRIYQTIFDKPYRIEYPDGSYETFVYSSKGELLESYDRLGNGKYFTYDDSGNLIQSKEYISSESSFDYFKMVKASYDERNQLRSTETFNNKVPKLSGQTEVTQSVNDRVEYQYDKAGRLTKVSGPYGKETQHEYDAISNVITKLQKVENGYYDVTRYSYDLKSQVTSESLLVKTSDLEMSYLSGAQFDKVYFDRVMVTNTYQYNENGQLISKLDPQGNVTLFEYDLDNRLTKKMDPMLTATTYRYDLRGNLVEETNAKGNSTFYEYDQLNQLIRKKSPSANGSLVTTRYVYDVMGNLIKEISPNHYVSSKDTIDSVLSMVGFSYQYDRMNRRIATFSPEDVGLEYIQYNALGQVVKVVDGIRFTGNMGASKGTVYEYDGLGRAVKITDALGYSTHYEYNVFGNVTNQTDARGNSTFFVYYPDSTLASVTFADGGSVYYTYDKIGRTTSETDQLGNTTLFTYTPFGKEKEINDPYNHTIESKYDRNGNLVSLKDKRGNTTVFTYDGNNRLTEKRVPLELDASGNIQYAIEHISYDDIGNIVKQTLSGTNSPLTRETRYTYYDNNLLETVSDNSGAFTKNFYDDNGNLIKTEKLREAGVYDVEKYAYDHSNRLVQHIELIDDQDVYLAGTITHLRDLEYADKIQSITEYQYDILGNKIKAIDPKGYMITNTYDVLHRVDKIIRNHNGHEVYMQFMYDELGNKITDRNERGYETHFTYDPVNRLKKVTDPKSNSIVYQHDLVGNKVSETNTKNQAMTYTYDKLNRLVMITDPLNFIIKKNIYDANGNIVKEIDAKGYLSGKTDQERYGTLYTYDLANRLVMYTDPEIAKLHEPHRFTAKYEYNITGEITKEIDALGNTHIYDYDDVGRLIKVTDPLNVSTTYGYDQLGNKLYMIDGRGKLTRYHYGAFGLLREVVNAENRKISYQYDLAGNIAQMIDKIGNQTLYTYDHSNQLTSRMVTETGDRITYSYDEVGNRISMTDESGTSNYLYDENNQLLQITKDDIMQIRYTYDSVGNIETITDKLGFITSYTYDQANRMKSVSYSGKTTSYTYDENGNRSAIHYQGGVTETYTYDRNNQLLQLVNKKPDGTILSKYTYTYDSAGREITKNDGFGTTNYSYDASGRIKKVESPGKTTVYTYDRAGNRQSQVETYTSAQPSGYTDVVNNQQIQYSIKKSEYVYSNANELLKHVEVMSDAKGIELLTKTTTYLYDENGNEIRSGVSYLLPHNRNMRQTTTGNPYGDQITDPIHSLIDKANNTYDGFNKLKKVEKVKGEERVIVEFLYNGDGLRTKKISRSSEDGYVAKEINYLYDRQHVILETDAEDLLSVRYIRGINYIARSSGDQYSYYLYNGHGDVVQTVSEAGEIENQYDFDIFGNPILTVEKEYTNAIRYAGEFYDEETGLYYLRARFYDPSIGRFISEDSYWGEDRNPLSLNLYTYAHNNPIRFIDPSGHAATSVDQLIKAIDAQKAIWWEEQNKKGSSTVWTAQQTAANNEANRLREQLAALEKGNASAQAVRDQRGDDAGVWEQYKLEQKTKENQQKQFTGSITQRDRDEQIKLESMVKASKEQGRNVNDTFRGGNDERLIREQIAKDYGMSTSERAMMKEYDYSSVVKQSNVNDKNYQSIMKELAEVDKKYQDSFGGTNPLDYINKNINTNNVNWLVVLEGFNDASAAALTFGATTWFDVGPKLKDKDLDDYYLGQYLGYNAVGIASAYAALASAGVATGGGAVALAGGPPGMVTGGAVAVGASVAALVEGGMSVYAFSKADEAFGNYNSSKGKIEEFKNYSAKEIEKKYDLKKGQFHQVKQDIVKDLSHKNSPYKDSMKKVGNNPDVHLSSNGTIRVMSRDGKTSFDTNWNIRDFLP